MVGETGVVEGAMQLLVGPSYWRYGDGLLEAGLEVGFALFM